MLIMPLSVVNLMETSAESACEVGRREHFEAIVRLSVGRLRLLVGVNTCRVGDVLPPVS